MPEIVSRVRLLPGGCPTAQDIPENAKRRRGEPGAVRIKSVRMQTEQLILFCGDQNLLVLITTLIRLRQHAHGLATPRERRGGSPAVPKCDKFYSSHLDITAVPSPPSRWHQP